MESEIIRIKCPNCGAVLSVKNMVGLETKTIPCPICKKPSHFGAYKKADAPMPVGVGEDCTDLGGETSFREKGLVVGKLVAMHNKQHYPLCEGVNVIGRKANTSVATIQIVTDDKKMSRQHAVIEVKKTPKAYIHRLKNHQNKNATYINLQLLEDGDVVVLNGGEHLKMGETVLLFVLE